MASLSGEKTLAELSAEFGVHPTMISKHPAKAVMDDLQAATAGVSCCFLFTPTSHPFWTGQPLAYPAVQKSGAAAFPGYGLAAYYMRAAMHYWFIIEEIFALA